MTVILCERDPIEISESLEAKLLYTTENTPEILRWNLAVA